MASITKLLGAEADLELIASASTVGGAQLVRVHNAHATNSTVVTITDAAAGNVRSVTVVAGEVITLIKGSTDKISGLGGTSKRVAVAFTN
jgi:hypothetical protein